MARSMPMRWSVGSTASLAQVVHLGAVEEHGHRILELVISDEIANLELEIALQMYREHVDRLDERLHEFRHSQELPSARAGGHGLMDAFYFEKLFRRG